MNPTLKKLLLYTAEPDSQTEQALTFLASWATANTPAVPATHTPEGRR